jgi:radical SAM superfamily enzyme YgiQ (UPF0313 family)
MREPGAILLIACYELGHQPLAVAWPAAFLAERGFDPAVMDVSVEPFDPGRAARARLVAISVPMHTALRLGVGVAERVRRVNPDCHIGFYGLYATLNADYLLAHGADSVLGGEVEEALVALAERLAAAPAGVRGGARPEIPAGLGGSAVAGAVGPAGAAGGAPRPVLARLRFPVPRRHGLPALDRYAQLEHGGRRVLAGYVASRGCKHRCRHCPIPPVYGGRFFVVDREVVQGDIRQLVAAGARHITFGDPDFLNGPGHALAVARALLAGFPGVTFDITAKVEHLLRHRRHLPELAALGCLFVVSAVESLSDTVLAHLDKGHTRADVGAALAAVREAGIALRPTWVPFTPWTTLEDYRDILDFVETEGLIDHVDPVQYSIRLLVPPGSLLAAREAMRPFLGALIADRFHTEWRHPDPSMDALQERVAALVAEAAERNEDPALTFARIRVCADAAAGAGGRTPAAPPADRPRAPRLTEAWFC